MALIVDIWKAFVSNLLVVFFLLDGASGVDFRFVLKSCFATSTSHYQKPAAVFVFDKGT